MKRLDGEVGTELSAQLTEVAEDAAGGDVRARPGALDDQRRRRHLAAVPSGRGVSI